MTTENKDFDTTSAESAVPETPNNKKKIVAAIAAVAIIGGGFAIYSSVNSTAEKKVTEFVDGINQEFESDQNGPEILFGDVETSLISSSVSVKDVLIKNNSDQKDALKADEITLSAKGYVENETLPFMLSAAVDNMAILDPETLKSLKSDTGMDYEDREIDLSVSYEVDQKKGTLNLASNISTSELSDISAKIDVVGFGGTWEALQEGYKNNKGDFNSFGYEEEKAIGKTLKDVKVKSLNLTYENQGEIEKMMEYAASENGLTVEDIKERMPMMIEHYIGENELSKEINSFIKNPKSLSLTMDPKDPVTFQELSMLGMAAMMGQTEKVIETLNIKVKSK